MQVLSLSLQSSSQHTKETSTVWSLSFQKMGGEEEQEMVLLSMLLFVTGEGNGNHEFFLVVGRGQAWSPLDLWRTWAA